MQNSFLNNSDSPIPRFEQMLKTNEVYYFDAEDFECIIQYYIDSGEINLAKKSLTLSHKATSGTQRLTAAKIRAFDF